MDGWIRRAIVVLSLAFATACDEDPTGMSHVARVVVGPDDQVITVGDSTTVMAVALTADSAVVPGVVLWRSLSPAIATIRVSGGTATVAGKAPGVVRIEAESGGRTGFVDVTVVAAPQVATVELLPASIVLEVGAEAAVQAVAKAADGAVITGRPVTWTITPAGSAAVAPQAAGWATVSAQAEGQSVLSATIDGVTSGAQVQVVAVVPPPAQVATVEISPSGFSLPVNHETSLQAIAKDANGEMISGLAVTWSSSVESVASVTPIGISPFANLLARSAGTTIIRATVAGITAEMTFQVTAAPPPVNEPVYLFFSTFNRGIWANQLLDFRQFLTAHGTNGPIADPAVVWSIDDPAIAVVDENGNVRGLTKGTARVRATAGAVSATTLVTVFQPVPSPVVYDLTFDWWDGAWHMPPQVGVESWTDGNGVEHDAVLWPASGSLTMTDDGDYTRVLVFQGWAVVDGLMQVVVEREVVDTGIASIMVGGETGYWMHSQTTGDVYELVFHQPGNLIMRAEVGTAPEHEYMFRMRQ